MRENSRLESALFSLGDSVDWPTPSPHLPARVVARIEAEPARAGPKVRRRVAWVAAVIALVAGLIVFSPAARQAVADLLGAAGIRIGFTSEEAHPPGADLDLGAPIALHEISEAVDFLVRSPAGDDPGPPDGVFLSDDGQLTLAWVGSERLPAAGDSGVSLLLAQRETHDLEFAEKLIAPGTDLQTVMVEGQPGIWIEGAPHTLTLLAADGTRIEETTRLAANVLLWEANGVNHRLETTGDLQSALIIAQTLEPVP